MKISMKVFNFIFETLIAVVMSLFLSLFMIIINVPMNNMFFFIWMKSFILSSVIAIPISLISVPLLRGIMFKIFDVEQGMGRPPQ